jgi:hypothetical protein
MKQAEIKTLLPDVFQRTAYPGTPIAGLLLLMEVLHAPSEEVLSRLDAIFDPRRTFADNVPYLASWVDLDRLFRENPRRTLRATPPFPAISTGVGRLRELTAAAAYLSKWRGTAKGLLSFLQIATGLTGFEVLEQVPGPNGQPIPFHIVVRAPVEAAVHRSLIERIIEIEKPAYVTCKLEFAQSIGEL